MLTTLRHIVKRLSLAWAVKPYEREALRQEAERLIGRPVSTSELGWLVSEFHDMSGTYYERALSALDAFTAAFCGPGFNMRRWKRFVAEVNPMDAAEKPKE